MVFVWAGVIAVALIIEIFTCDLISSWFAVAGVVALALAAVGVDVSIQIVVFFAVSIVLLISLRPFVKRFIRTETVATNADANIGKRARLESDAVEGRATIKINGIIWTAVCEGELKRGDLVVITGISGNKYTVNKAEV